MAALHSSRRYPVTGSISARNSRTASLYASPSRRQAGYLLLPKLYPGFGPLTQS